MARKIFCCKAIKNDVQPRYMYFGKLKMDENTFEECLMVFFKAPFSYTGEDVVEFQIHGGVLLAQKVLDLCIANGARLAEPGEYSKRAFINGKISLEKAEAIIGEINAQSEAELKNSLLITNGRLASKILEQQEKLKYLLAEIEVGLDYPDETDEGKLKTNINDKIAELLQETEVLLEQSKSMKYISNGINVALVGKTNVGKSSLMNALLGQDRAIVTDVKGTTRDNLRETFMFNGIRINLIDTAGIRETDDVVENIGIAKSKESLSNADVVLFVLDGSENLDEQDAEILKLLDGKNVITVINKLDKQRKLAPQKNEIEVSALENKNIEKLKKKIYDTVIEKEIDTNAVVLANERQTKILQDCQQLMKDILKEQTTLDVISSLIKQLWQKLGKITGNTENEDIINLIFSKFCLGK